MKKMNSMKQQWEWTSENISAAMIATCFPTHLFSRAGPALMHDLCSGSSELEMTSGGEGNPIEILPDPRPKLFWQSSEPLWESFQLIHISEVSKLHLQHKPRPY